MNRDELLNLNFDGLVIDDSPIHGQGLYTLMDFQEGQDIHPAFLDLAQTVPARYINHSQTPNVRLELRQYGFGNVIMMVADKNIYADTELTANYEDLISVHPHGELLAPLVRFWEKQPD